MTKLKWMLSSAAAASALMAVPASAATFLVSQIGGGVSAIGSITTDGTLGVLSTANVTTWSLNLNDGFGTFTLNGTSNSQLLVQGSDLTATATGLFFNFSGTGFALFQNPSVGSGINFVCFVGNAVCGGAGNRTSVSVSNFGGGFAQQGVQQIGRLAAAPAVPEPASWAMMISGFALAGLALRRRKTNVTVSYAL